MQDILYFRSDDKCTRVVARNRIAGRNEEAVIRASLKELLETLDPDSFWQIHRSVIVQVRAIEHLRRTELGTMEVCLEGAEERLPVSQAFQHRFRGM
ncbi:MAG: LytTR family DNA-binding domain-containing protein [Steroidobacteraceae bacterium]